MDDGPLEQRVMIDKSNGVSFKEYAKVFASVEGGAYLGANVGIYLSDFLTRNKIIITGGTLAGDYIGGTLGYMFSNWHNNKEKYTDSKSGKFNYLIFIKDNAKILAYGTPLAFFSYAVTSQVTYQAVEHNYENWAVATISSLTMMTIYNGLNYFIYKVIKNDSDERFMHKLGSSLKPLFHKKGHGGG